MIVPETITGKRRPISSKKASSANSAALPFSVSKIVSTRNRSTPPLARASIASSYAATRTSKRHVARTGVIDRRARSTRCDWSGRARRRRSAACPVVRAVHASAHSRAIRAAATLISPHPAFEPIVRLRDRRRVERVGADDVGAGLEIGIVDRANDVGPRQHQEVVVALEVVRMAGEAGAAIVGLAEPVALDHRAHRAVQDQDALLEQMRRVRRCGRVAWCTVNGEGAGRLRRASNLTSGRRPDVRGERRTVGARAGYIRANQSAITRRRSRMLDWPP